MEKAIFDKDSIHKFLSELDLKLNKRLIIFMIGGGAMCLKNLKANTFDIDIIVKTQKEFNILKQTLLKLGFKIDEDVHDTRIYNQAMMVFFKGSSRIDVFVKSICGMLDFTYAMEERASLFKKFKKLTVKLASNEDILFLKSLSDREKDLPDCRNLIETGLKWDIILKECISQHRKDTKWIFWLFEQICRVASKYNITIPAKSKMLKICLDNWDKKPDDWMVDFSDEQIKKHIPKKYQSELLKSLKEYKH